MRKFEQWQDRISRLFPEYLQNEERVLSQTVTFQVTDDCNLACSYCYQIHKGKRSMSFETAKKFIDLIVSGEKGFSNYINPEKSPGIIVEFIGGEPFLEIDLIDQICDYFSTKLIEERHPWATRYMFSICSNGVLYFDERVQRFLRKWNGHISFSVTIDGNKELHDSCRKFPDGRPSYDLAVAAAKDWMSRGYYMGSKITIAPDNVAFLYDAIKHMVELGYTDINANCVYEKGWEPKHAAVMYEEMKKISDYFLEKDLDFEHDFFCSLYNDDFFRPKKEDDLQNWCFKAGTKILTPDGNINIEDIKIGDIVITGNGKEEPVIGNTHHFAEDAYKIKTAGMDAIYTTSEHPFLVKKFLYTGNKGVRHFSEPMWVKASELNKYDKIALYKHQLGNADVDHYLAYIVGRYIGDGWKSTTGYKICSSYDEVEELCYMLDKANIKYSTTDYRTVKQFNIFKSNEELLSIISDAGLYASGKKIPKVVFSWNKNSVEWLLKGLFDADGNFTEKDQRQRFSTVSSALIQDVAILLRGLGYIPMICMDNKPDREVIEGRIVKTRNKYELYYYIDSNRSKRCYFDRKNNVIWSTVYSSEPTDSYEVYNLTVSEEHTFIANGAIVHNCGGNGVMLSCDPDGWLFPCLRYMESSLGGDQEPYSIGHVDIGICQTECDKCRVDCLRKIDRRTQSTDECFYCPIAEGCSWCTAYNYQVFGTPDARATYICIMHKARALGNAYFWNKYYRKNGINKRMKIYVPDEWALDIISESELKMLKELEE